MIVCTQCNGTKAMYPTADPTIDASLNKVYPIQSEQPCSQCNAKGYY